MSQNAYEIRYQLLKDAREMLFKVWEEDCQTLRFNADLKHDCGCQDFEPTVMPAPPTVEAIIALAEQMDTFVSCKH